MMLKIRMIVINFKKAKENDYKTVFKKNDNYMSLPETIVTDHHHNLNDVSNQ